jgi:predicted metal-binding protein
MFIFVGMVNLLIFILATVGLTWGITRSKAFKPFREWITGKARFNRFFSLIDALLSCWGCTGFWVAMLIYEMQIRGYLLVLYALIGTTSCLVIIGLINFLDRK